MKRRNFLIGGLAAVGAGGAYVLIAQPQRAIPSIPRRPDAVTADAQSWIAYNDGRYTLSLCRAEIGQNISTGLKQIACAELDVPWDQVDVVLADTNAIMPFRATVGSESIEDFGVPLARACAALRDAVADGRSGEIEVDERPFEDLRAFEPGAMPRNVPLVGVRDIVTGNPLFAGDVQVPNMAYGRVLRAPASPEYQSWPRAWDVDAAADIAGFVGIVEDEGLTMNRSAGLGILARTPGALDRIEAALSVEWESDVPEGSDAFADWLDVDRRSAEGAPEYTLERADAPDPEQWTVDLRIDTPLAAHAPIEPRAAVADVGSSEARLWVGTQDPFYVRDALSKSLNLPKDAVTVVPQRVGGGFGGKAVPLVEQEAAVLSRSAGQPVKVQWTRAQELAYAYHRPATSHRVKARVEDGRITHWSHRMASGHVIFSSAVLPPWMQRLTDFIGDDGAARDLTPVYAFDAVSTGFDLERLPIRTGAWRGLGSGPNTLAIDMAMEAYARAEGLDPVAFRLDHITDLRLRAVLESVRDIAGYRPRPGLGVGCGVYKGVSYGAVIAEARLDENGIPRISRLYCAHDCGRIVNPDLVRAQCEGNLAWSLGMILLENLDVQNGGIASQDFFDAPIPAITDLPPIEIELLETDAAPTGAGETLMASAPAAIFNALQSLAPAPITQLPVTAEHFKT